MLLENGVSPIFENQAGLVQYDTALFNRWSSLGILFYKDLYKYILSIALVLERGEFWRKIHFIFESTKMSKCGFVRGTTWNVKKELECLLCTSNPKCVTVCSEGCCFAFEGGKYIFTQRGCCFPITNTKECWKKAFMKEILIWIQFCIIPHEQLGYSSWKKNRILICETFFETWELRFQESKSSALNLGPLIFG